MRVRVCVCVCVCACVLSLSLLPDLVVQPRRIDSLACGHPKVEDVQQHLRRRSGDLGGMEGREEGREEVQWPKANQAGAAK